MLFNSHVFIFLFLPVTLLIYFVLGKRSTRMAAAWLTIASLFFYGWWNPAYIFLLVISILFNYSIGTALVRENARDWNPKRRKKTLLIIGITINLLILGYYKYSNFFLFVVSESLSIEWTITNIVLPLGISFFTFTQITFLVDAFRGEVKENNLIYYSLFVTYFPHLIAGPILYHKEMMPQFGRQSTYRFNYENLAVGLTIFSIGLCKKVIFADSIAPYAQAVFKAASNGQTLTFIEAWAGSIGYSLQLYFDFSGYSDMAIGLARLFGLRLPLNFYSPYQATSIIEFWRRWHMTLSRFLKDYLYIPLGGNRKGSLRRFVNVMITMLLGGLWHGAGWTFILWGGIHCLYILTNYAWRVFRSSLGYDLSRSTWWRREASRAFTFVVVVLAWVLFRAEGINAALNVYKGMIGLNGFVLPQAWMTYLGPLEGWLSDQGVLFGVTPVFTHALQGSFLIISLFVIAWYFPNTQQIMDRFEPAIETYRNEDRTYAFRIKWMPNLKWAVGSGLLITASIIMIDKVSEFLYFQF